MRIGQVFRYTVVVALFALVVDVFAWLQFTYILRIESEPRYFLIPSLVGTVFGSILVLYRHYYLLARERIYYERIAKVDSLTGAMSRYACDLILDHESKRCERGSKPFSLVMFDIDDFKSVNDRFGHLEGDRILKALCFCILEQLRDADTLCRWGGEEFIAIIPETSEKEVLQLGERLRHAVASYDFGIDMPVTISIGIVTAPPRCRDIGTLIAQADNALYEAKQNGKNRIVVAQTR